VAGVIAMAPNACFLSPEFFRTRAVPLAIIGATSDRYAPNISNAAWAARIASDSAPHAFASLLGGNHVYMTDYCFPDWLATKIVPVDDRALIATMAPYGPGIACGAPPAVTWPSMGCGEEHALIRKVVTAFSREMLLKDSRAVDTLIGRHGMLAVTATRQALPTGPN
jgi:hypothetical protein